MFGTCGKRAPAHSDVLICARRRQSHYTHRNPATTALKSAPTRSKTPMRHLPRATASPASTSRSVAAHGMMGGGVMRCRGLVGTGAGGGVKLRRQLDAMGTGRAPADSCLLPAAHVTCHAYDRRSNRRQPFTKSIIAAPAAAAAATPPAAPAWLPASRPWLPPVLLVPLPLPPCVCVLGARSECVHACCASASKFQCRDTRP
jgi:hypothetical protein